LFINKITTPAITTTITMSNTIFFINDLYL
jgi:hypothetical protein